MNAQLFKTQDFKKNKFLSLCKDDKLKRSKCIQKIITNFASSWIMLLDLGIIFFVFNAEKSYLIKINSIFLEKLKDIFRLHS